MPITPWMVTGRNRRVKPDEAKNVTRWWDGLSSEQRRQVMDFFLETAGGVAGAAKGAAIGSAGGPVGAAIGGVVGAGVGSGAGRGASIAMDAYDNPNVYNANRVMREVGEAAAMGAAGEGLGRTIPVVARAAKNAARAAFSPTEEAKVLTQLADKYGIPLNLAERSGRTLPKLVEVALDRMPFSTGVIRKFRNEQYRKWADQLGELRGSAVSRDEFAAKADQLFRGLRDDLDAFVQAETQAVARNLNPAPVNRVEAGTALQQGRNRNLNKVREWANQEYGKVREEIGDLSVDLEGIGDVFSNLSDEGLNILGGKTKTIIGNMRRMGAVEQGASQLDEAARGFGLADADELRSAQPQLYDQLAATLPPAETTSKTATVNELLDLRSEIMRNLRRWKHGDSASDLETMATAVDRLNDAIESAAKSAGVDKEEAFKRLADTNRQYKEFMRDLYPPVSAGKPGNPGAGVIQNAQTPESIPGRIANSPTLTEGALTAARPSTVASIAPGSADAVDPTGVVARNILDESVEGATLMDNRTGGTRISPTRLRQQVENIDPQVRQSLFGVHLPMLRRVTSPEIVRQESLLFNSPMAQAVDAGGADRIVRAAFPPKSPTVAQETMKVFDNGGMGNVARNAYVDDLLTRSTGADAGIGPAFNTTDYISGNKLTRLLSGQGDTTAAVVGSDAAGQLDDLATVGRGLRSAEREYGNPSGTARGLEVLNVAGTLAASLFNPVVAAGIAGSGASANALARGFTNQNLVRGLTSPRQPLAPMLQHRMAGPLGAVGQTAARTNPSFFGVSVPNMQQAESQYDADFKPFDYDPDFTPLQ